MKWPWGRRPAKSQDMLDAEFERTKRTVTKALDDLKLQVERTQYKEAARERQRQQRTQPGAAGC